LGDIIQNQSEDDQLYSIEGFSEEEQGEIRQQIDLISEQNRIPVTDELFKITPSKKGGTLPLVINIIGIIAIAAGFYLSNRYFQAQEQTMAMEESSYESTEGSVIEELKKQAEEKLNLKEKEIANIQVELARLDEQSASLKANMDSQIRDKELELRSEMEDALADERARLQGQGISTAELEKQLQEFQTARENAFTAEIADFKSESEAAIKEKEEELAKSKQIANDILEQANRDKAAIEADTQKREAELTEQFEAEKEALARETSEATRKLQELSELQKNEQLIQDQLTGSYNSIIESIKESNYPVAKIGIDDVRNLLNDPNVTRLPSISKRKNVELYFLDSLEKEIQQAGVRTTTDFTSMTRAAEVLLSARQSVEYGADAEREGNQYEAKRFYNEALSTLPQIAKAVENLNIIETSNRTAISGEYLTLGNQALGSGQLNEAIKQYRAAAMGTAPDNTEPLSTAINGIERALTQDNEKLAANLESLESSNAELESEKNHLEQTVADNDKNVEEIKNNAEILTTQVEDSKKTIEQLNLEADESEKTIATLTTEAKKSAFAIDTLTKKAARATYRAEVLEEELNDAVNQIVELIN